MNEYKILGVKISKLCSYKYAYEKVIENLDTPSFITVNNVHTVVEAARNKDYKKIINNSRLSFADGRPITIYASNILKIGNIKRIFGPTFLEKSLVYGREINLKHFIFGGDPKNLLAIRSTIAQNYPGVNVVGYLSPPFKDSFSHEENESFLREINESDADIIWVALGAPKQERWIYENYYRLNRGVMIGIGAGINYLSGKINHAPNWMKENSLEWLYRLIQEPKRLWKRYLYSNTLFIYMIIKEMLVVQKYRNK